MGYPTTTFDLYADGRYKASINIVGDATKQWPFIVDVIATNFPEVNSIAVYNQKGERIVLVSL